jgi:hypothetical protein
MRPRNSRWSGLVRLLVAAALLTDCHPTRSEQDTIRRWLLCEECREGELRAVVALQDNATGTLGEALKGPPAANRDQVGRQAEAMFARLASPPLTQPEYVTHYVANYVATYQSRAATALGAIGTSKARAILLDALLTDSLSRPDVLRAIGAAGQFVVATVVSDTQDAPVDSFARINPSVTVRASASGQGRAGVRVLFRVERGGGGLALDSVQRTDSAGRAEVRWRMGHLDSLNVIRAEAVGQSIRFFASSHGLTPRVVFAVQPDNGHPLQPILPVVRVAVVDAWGDTAVALNGSAELSVVGTGFSVVRPLSAGVAEFPGLILHLTGTGFRLRVAVAGATPGLSQAFNLVP